MQELKINSTELDYSNVNELEIKPQLERQYIISNDSFTYKFFNHTIDILLAVFLLIVTFPVILIFAFLIKLESAGPILYSQKRLGLNNKEFYIYKLRSMYVDAENNGAVWATQNDSRVTKIGKIIRKTRIDELPQIYNVLKRDMSLIGPRPERKIFVDEFSIVNPLYLQRTTVRPGLTGWAQVNGGYDIDPFQKLDKDFYYIRNQSIKLDFIIMIKTIKVIISGDGAR